MIFASIQGELRKKNCELPGLSVRAVFIIDPQSKVRAMLYYPMSNGRNMAEIRRLVAALQTSADFGVATPANWIPGEEVILPPPNSCGAAKERVASNGGNVRVVDWFLTLTKLDTPAD